MRRRAFFADLCCARSHGSPRRPRAVVLGAAALLLACAACAGLRSGPRAPPPRPAPGTAPALVRGDVARREGRTEAALREYERAIAEDPESVRAHLRYVSLLVEMGRRSVAREVYAARARAGAATEADRVLAERLSGDGSAASVRAVYVRAVKASPGNAWWRLALAEVDLASADRWSRKAAAERAAGDRPADRALETARGALARADAAVEHAGERDPSLPEVDLYRGLVRSLEGDLLAGDAARDARRAAAEAFRRATAADPSMVDAWAGLADATYRAGDLACSLAAWLEAIRLAPGDADLREGAGLSLHDLGRYADAAGQYAEAARARPAEAGPLVSLGDSWAAAGDFERAAAAYRQALERDSTAVEAHGRLGTVLERTGHPAEARQEYETYLERGGAHAADIKRRMERLIASGGKE